MTENSAIHSTESPEAVIKAGRRKSWLINPKFQLSFLAYSVGIAAVVSIVYYISIRAFFWKFTHEADALALPPDHVFYTFLASQQATMDLVFLVTSWVIVMVLVGSGLYLSNRVAGPVHNAQQYLLSRARGEAKHSLKFRKSDYFHELADSINQNFPDSADQREASE